MTRPLARRTAFGAAVLLLCVSTAPAAQTATGAVGVNAIVDAPLTGAALRDLDFARIAPGLPQTVAPSDVAGCALCSSGKWRFSNLAFPILPIFFFARLTFTTLPATLVGPGGATLPLTWTNGARACLERNGAEYHCYAPWTPAQGVTQSLRIGGAGAPPTPGGLPIGRNMNVYLGGTAQPAISQRAGIYVGSVTLQFAYGSS
jgi:hypothetical protein